MAHEPFSCVEAARPRRSGSQQLVSSDAAEEDDRDYDFIWDHVVSERPATRSFLLGRKDGSTRGLLRKAQL